MAPDVHEALIDDRRRARAACEREAAEDYVARCSATTATSATSIEAMPVSSRCHRPQPRPFAAARQARARRDAEGRQRLSARHDRGTSLLDRITGGVPVDDNKLMKFHGIYQQDDRDMRDERRRQKLEPAYSFMVRVRLPGGVCTPEQWLKLDELARAHGGDTLRLTTRQTFQFHWVLKEDLRPTIQGLHEVLLDTIAACGDDARGVMCSVNPQISALHAEVYALAKQASDHAIPKTRAYHEIWYGEERVATSETGGAASTAAPTCRESSRSASSSRRQRHRRLYPGSRLHRHRRTRTGSKGFNVAIGGGMGRTDQAPEHLSAPRRRHRLRPEGPAGRVPPTR